MSFTRIKYNSEIEYEIDNIENKRYYKIGTRILHRLDGPAVEFANGAKLWYKNNQYHRADGPAMEWPNGLKAYWMHGNYIIFSGTAEEFLVKNLLE